MVTPAVLLVFYLVWHVLKNEALSGPVNSLGVSLLAVATASPLLPAPFWALLILNALGLVVVVMRASVRWWIGPLVVGVVLWVVASVVPEGTLRHELVAGFYADPSRLAALLGIALVPLSALGFDWLWLLIKRVLSLWSRTAGQWARGIGGVILCVALVGGIQLTTAMASHIDIVYSRYIMDPELSMLVTPDENELLSELPGLIPSGVRVATDAYNGSSMAYALFNIPTTTTSLGYTPKGNEAIIESFLNQVAGMPELVCPALKQLNVGYVLDFGYQRFGDYYRPSTPGFRDLGIAQGFTLVKQVGEAKLYRIDACN